MATRRAGPRRRCQIGTGNSCQIGAGNRGIRAQSGNATRKGGEGSPRAEHAGYCHGGSARRWLLNVVVGIQKTHTHTHTHTLTHTHAHSPSGSPGPSSGRLRASRRHGVHGGREAADPQSGEGTRPGREGVGDRAARGARAEEEEEEEAPRRGRS